MKNVYEIPELEISLFLKSDVMTVSDDNTFNDPWAIEEVDGNLDM